MNNSEETEEIKTFPLYPYLLQGQQALLICKAISVGRPDDARYTTPLPHPITPTDWSNAAVLVLFIRCKAWWPLAAFQVVFEF